MNEQILLQHATQEQLLTFARNTLGLNLPPNTKKETLLGKIKVVWEKDYLLVSAKQSEPEQQVAGTPIPITDGQQPPESSKVRIIIQPTEEAGGNDPVQVGVNGKVMLIPRGEEVDIPLSYFEVLKHAITYKYGSNPDGSLNPVARKVPLYPFQRVA